MSTPPESEASDAAERLPIFRQALGEDWDKLGEVIRRHYFLRALSGDAITVHGTMHEVWHSQRAKLLLPLARLFGALVPYCGKHVPIQVHYSARPNDATLHWDRVFYFPGRAPFHFRSHMALNGPNRVIEFVRFGVGMKLVVTAEDGALVFRDQGYIWRLFGYDIPLPMGLLMGRAYVEERPVDDQRFATRMTLTHPLFGELFRYDGTFALGLAHASDGALDAAPPPTPDTPVTPPDTTDFAALDQLIFAYLHQDMDLEAASVPEAIANFSRAETPAFKSALRVAMRRFEQCHAHDLHAEFERRYRYDYVPDRPGQSVSAFFDMVRAILEDPDAYRHFERVGW